MPQPVTIEAKQLAVTKRYGWYIMNALRYKIASMEKAVIGAKQSQIDDAKLGLSADDPRAQGLQSMLDHVEQALSEYKEAFEKLNDAGIN